ncbi:MAG: SUF system Fe-S cluster assembly regulator [Thauera sp.]|jgi:FeS assembly SUF system regulator|nr:SUF system Fe-S cluster assembly regulator [Thauera sp.]
MLRISKLTDYGTLIVTEMASRAGERVSASDLAGALGLGPATVSKILKALARNGLVNSHRGSLGGYELARPAAQITLADLVDALEEQDFGLTECSARSGVCGHEGDCRIRAGWLRVNTVVRRALQTVSIADMTPTDGHALSTHGASCHTLNPTSLARPARS